MITHYWSVCVNILKFESKFSHERSFENGLLKDSLIFCIAMTRNLQDVSFLFGTADHEGPGR